MKKIDIFYKSYSNDFKWLYLSLESLKKYITGYNEIIIVIPERDKHLFNYDFDFPERTYIHTIQEENKGVQYGYLFQQYVKMIAHHYSGADYILFSDSDCIFLKHKNIQEQIKNDKITILYTDYNNVGEAICWKKPTEKALSYNNIPYEFMRVNCLMYKKTSLELLEKFLNRNLKQYITNEKAFSEFNVMGAFCYYHDKDNYSFINTENHQFEPSWFKQFWSYSGLTEFELKEIKSVL